MSATFASSSVAQRKRRSTVQPHKNALTRAVRSARKKKKQISVRLSCSFSLHYVQRRLLPTTDMAKPTKAKRSCDLPIFVFYPPFSVSLHSTKYLEKKRKKLKGREKTSR